MGFEQMRHDGGMQVTVLVNNRASSNIFDDQRMNELKHCPLDDIDPTLPRKILAAR